MKDFKSDTLSSEPYKQSKLVDIPSDVVRASVRVIPVRRSHIPGAENPNTDGVFFTVNKL
jgi:hypothetical protein